MSVLDDFPLAQKKFTAVINNHLEESVAHASHAKQFALGSLRLDKSTPDLLKKRSNACYSVAHKPKDHPTEPRNWK
eukprot:2843930-Amphidinium_carterae.2